ncbi:hypothetical protein [Runella limosa]|uniref:hypothetical protein n=1 Tax=Runella limosa TaxID=370978 RepID=UPI0004018123|nr:hypothetical protein [Runella limosa]
MYRNIVSSIVLVLGWLVASHAYATSRDSSVRWQPGGIGIQVGLTGVGVQLAWKLKTKPRLVLRVGASYVGYKKATVIDIGEGSKIDLFPNIVIGLVQSSVKWHPFKKGAFFLTGGVGYTWRPDLRLTVQAQNDLNLGGISMKADEFGTVGLGLKWSPIVGYAGLGMGRSIPRRRWGVGFELGCYYLGPPKVQMDLNGFLETTTLEAQIPLIERNMSGYRYLPSFQLTVSYALVKKAWR